MNTTSCSISTCRSCRYYTPEGRRGGQCQQLSAPVCGSWKACSLAFPPFAPSWEHLEKLISLNAEAPASNKPKEREKTLVGSQTVAVRSA